MKNPRISSISGQSALSPARLQNSDLDSGRRNLSPMAMLEAIGSKDNEEALADLVAVYDMLARVGSTSEEDDLYNQWIALTEQRDEGKKVTAKNAKELLRAEFLKVLDFEGYSEIARVVCNRIIVLSSKTYFVGTSENELTNKKSRRLYEDIVKDNYKSLTPAQTKKFLQVFLDNDCLVDLMTLAWSDLGLIPIEFKKAQREFLKEKNAQPADTSIANPPPLPAQGLIPGDEAENIFKSAKLGPEWQSTAKKDFVKICRLQILTIADSHTLTNNELRDIIQKYLLEHSKRNHIEALDKVKDSIGLTQHSGIQSIQIKRARKGIKTAFSSITSTKLDDFFAAFKRVDSLDDFIFLAESEDGMIPMQIGLAAKKWKKENLVSFTSESKPLDILEPTHDSLPDEKNAQTAHPLIVNPPPLPAKAFLPNEEVMDDVLSMLFFEEIQESFMINDLRTYGLHGVLGPRRIERVVDG